MKFSELMNKCTTFDPKAIEKIKLYIPHTDSICNEITDYVEPANRGSWSVLSTFIVPKHGPVTEMVSDFEVDAIGIEDEHTLGIIIKR